MESGTFPFHDSLSPFLHLLQIKSPRVIRTDDIQKGRNILF